mgnify:CR=1 FL=1
MCTHNETLRQYCIDHGARVETSSVIYPGVDMTRFFPAPPRQDLQTKLGIKQNDSVLVFMGSIFRFSGLTGLLTELAPALRNDPSLKLLILGIALLAGLWAWITWKTDIKTVLGHMKDFKLSEYLTRKVASYLYTFYFISIIGLAAVGIPIYASTTYGINQDYAAFPMVTIAGVVITFVVILAIRLVFELAVAIVHIAENTKPGLRR